MCQFLCLSKTSSLARIFIFSSTFHRRRGRIWIVHNTKPWVRETNQISMLINSLFMILHIHCLCFPVLASRQLSMPFIQWLVAHLFMSCFRVTWTFYGGFYSPQWHLLPRAKLYEPSCSSTKPLLCCELCHAVVLLFNSHGQCGRLSGKFKGDRSKQPK